MRTSDRTIAIISLIVGTTLGIAGLASAYYFYVESIQERIPTALVNPTMAVILDSNGPQLSDLTVSYKGKPVGLGGIVAVRFYFWNSGTMPIQRTDILRPIQCILPDGTEILDAKILSSSREVTGLKIAIPNGTPNIIEITFDVLEHNDGGAIQLIYAGNRDAAIAFRGVVIGSKSINVDTAYVNENDVPLIKLFRLKWEGEVGSIVYMCLLVGGMFLIMNIVIRIDEDYPVTKAKVVFNYTSLTLTVVVIIVAGGYSFFLQAKHPYQTLADVPSVLVGEN